MPSSLRQMLSWGLRAFRAASDGQITLIVAVILPVLVLAGGGGIDLMRAYQARQKLSEVATLACQYASRPSVTQMAGANTASANASYVSSVNTYITAALQTQKFNVAQTNATPFTYVANGPANVRLAASVPTAFAKIIRINQIPVQSALHCYDTPSALPTPSPYVTKEGFEASSGTGLNGWGYAFYPIPGRGISTPTSNPGPTPEYTGSDGSTWYGTGYCLERDSVGVISSTVPEGQNTAELDCDNGSGSAGNSAISTRVYLSLGNYELRYNFRSRVAYPDYDPAYLCGSTAGDLAFANSTNSSGSSVANALRTNQINVYLDKDTTGTAPLHTTIDGTQQLAGANLIDLCVQSMTWIERSVRIYVGTPGYYWLSFAADGQSDSYGGQIDNIRLCVKTCPGTVQDDFPVAWTAAGNGGVSKVLFEDRFESPTYPEDSPAHGISKGGNLNLSTGTSGTSASGWPGQGATGWATAPFNQVNYGVRGAYEGNQYILMDGYNANGSPLRNRVVSRPFLLDPGYYQVSYDYISIVDFSGSNFYGNYCYASPNSGAVFPVTPTINGVIRYYNPITTDAGTNIVGVFMSHGALVSTPITGNAQGSATSYTNPDGTTSTTPTVAPDKVNWQSYDATAVNPVIDVCGYVNSFQWVPRTTAVKIAKPGIYWLTFSANGGLADGNGGGVDDVKVTALGSPYMANPPSVATAIPVPSPQPSATISFNGFSIVADPFMPTAPLQ